MDRPPPRDSLSTHDIRAMYLQRSNGDTSSIKVWSDASKRRVVVGVALLVVTCALLIGLSRYDFASFINTVSGTTNDVAAERPVATDDVASTSAKNTPTAKPGTGQRDPVRSSKPIAVMPLISVETLQAFEPVPTGDADINAAIAEPLPTDASALEPPVYSANDADVSPPVAIRTAGIATDRSSRDNGASLIEILVSETGRVESARARQWPTTVGATLETTTALSVVKTWRFSPARKDGQPVKYRTTVPFVQTMNPAGMTVGSR